MRVLLANEPRSYREVIAAAVRGVRPDVEVMAVAPEGLVDAVLAFAPDLVVCSGSCSGDHDYTCVSLYPGGGSISVIAARGARRDVPDIQFETLVNLIDELGGAVAA